MRLYPRRAAERISAAAFYEESMKILNKLLLAMILLSGVIANAAHAGPNDPLFVNVLTDDAHRAQMAIVFSRNQMERGHAVTLFFNDKSVRVLSSRNSRKFSNHQKLLKEIMDKGAAIFACRMCMEHYKVDPQGLIPGARIGNPDLVGAALFKDNTKTLTW